MPSHSTSSDRAGITEQVNLIADLEVLQAAAQGFGHVFRLSHRVLWRVGAHSDPIQARPSRLPQKAGEVAHRFRGHRVVLSPWLADDFTHLRMFRFLRVRRRLPPLLLAGVPA